MIVRSSKANPCPVCGAVSRCSTDVLNNRYFCYKVNKTTGHFQYLKKSGVFNIFRNSNVNDKTINIESRAKAVQQTAKKDEYSINVCFEDLVSDIALVFETLKLNASHKADLINRGLTDEQITAINPVSVDFKSTVTGCKGYAPGFNADGVWAMGRAMLVPIYSLEQEIVGYQVKNDNKDYGKYVWAKCSEDKLIRNDSKLLVNGSRQLPIQHHIPNPDVKTLYLCEGTLKPLVAGFKHSINVLGASGGSFISSEDILSQTISSIKPTKIIWLADAGSSLNTQVAEQITTHGKFIKANFDLDLKIADWGQLEDKTTPNQDCDEISNFELSTANLVDHRFFHINISSEEINPKVAYAINSELPRKEVFGTGFNQLTNDFNIVFDGTLPSIEYRNTGQVGYYFEPEQRQELLSLAYHRGYHYVLDVSQTGASKSHYSGELETDRFIYKDGSANKVWYFHSRHRDPSTTTLDKNFTEHPTKNTILYDSGKRTPHFGKPVLVRDRPHSKAGYNSGNCHLAGEQTELYEAGVALSLCGGCPFSEKCKTEESPGEYGYRFQVTEALKNDRIRANYYGINPKSVNEDDIAIIDEYSQTLQFVDTVNVSRADWAGSLGLMRSILGNNTTILDRFAKIINGKISISHFGLNYSELEQLDMHNQWNSLIAYVQRADHAEEEENAQRAATGSPPRLVWIAKLFRVLSGQDSGSSIVVRNNGFSIYTRNIDTLEKLDSFRTVVFMDATSTRQSLADELGCDTSEILLISCKPKPVDNVIVHQIVSIGTPNKNRGKNQIDSIGKLREWATNKYDGNVGFIDWKKFCKKGDLAHFVDGRGSNAFQDKKAVMTFGSANVNLCASKATFECIMRGKLGVGLEYDDFSDYYERLRQAETEQEIGRLRGSRRTEELHYFAVTTSNLSYLSERGYDFRVVRGFEIDESVCNFKEAIIFAAIRLRDAGQLDKLKFKALAKEAGKCTKATTKFVKGFKGGYPGFINTIHRKLLEDPETLVDVMVSTYGSAQGALGHILDIAELKDKLIGFRKPQPVNSDKLFLETLDF